MALRIILSIFAGGVFMFCPFIPVIVNTLQSRTRHVPRNRAYYQALIVTVPAQFVLLLGFAAVLGETPINYVLVPYVLVFSVVASMCILVLGYWFFIRDR